MSGVVAAACDVMHLTATGCEWAYWTLTSDVSLPGVASVAVVPEYEQPTATTGWAAAVWDGEETVTGAVHTRVARLLLAGPANGTNPGSPLVVGAGAWDTWVGVDSGDNRIERRMGRLVVGQE